MPELARRFLYDQPNPDAEETGDVIPLERCPDILGKAYLFNLARAVYYAPSALCGTGGCTASVYVLFRRGTTVYIGKSGEPGLKGLQVGRVFGFKHDGITYPCAPIQWFSIIGEIPCDETGMWIGRAGF